MTGNEDSIHSPEKAYNRSGFYPNSIYNEDHLNQVFMDEIICTFAFLVSNSSKCAFPLVCYNIMSNRYTLRPIRELFTVLNVEDDYNKSRIRPDFGSALYQMHRFLQVPVQENEDYPIQTNTWASDVHLMSTYAYLSEEETKVFAANEQKYLFLDVKETTYSHIVGSQRIDVETSNLVSNWFWYLKRSDQYLRNEWTNYTNREFSNIPNVDLSFTTLNRGNEIETYPITQYPTTNNSQHILQKVSILLDGKYRENEFDSDIRYIEKYAHCKELR